MSSYNRNYRRDELHPSVWAKLELARHEKNACPRQQVIDNIIHLQLQRSVEVAIKYIGYAYFGEYSWQDIFSEETLQYEKENKHYEVNEDLLEIISKMNIDMDILRKQVSEMQVLIINMAKALNHSNNKNYRSA